MKYTYRAVLVNSETIMPSKRKKEIGCLARNRIFSWDEKRFRTWEDAVEHARKLNGINKLNRVNGYRVRWVAYYERVKNG